MVLAPYAPKGTRSRSETGPAFSGLRGVSLRPRNDLEPTPSYRAGPLSRRSQELGYSATFIVLGCFALASVALWIGFRALVSAAAAVPADEAEEFPSSLRVAREARSVAG